MRQDNRLGGADLSAMAWGVSKYWVRGGRDMTDSALMPSMLSSTTSADSAWAFRLAGDAEALKVLVLRLCC